MSKKLFERNFNLTSKAAEVSKYENRRNTDKLRRMKNFLFGVKNLLCFENTLTILKARINQPLQKIVHDYFARSFNFLTLSLINDS